MHLYQILYLTAVFLAALEIFTPTFILLGFSIGLVAVGLLEQFTLQGNFKVDLIAFTIVSFLVIIGFRKLFHDKKDVKQSDGDINQY